MYLVNILNTAGPPLAKLNALQRWQGVRTTPTTDPKWIWYIVTVVLVIAVVLIIASVITHLRERLAHRTEKPQSKRTPKKAKTGEALTASDVDLLTRLLRKSGFVKPEMEFTLPHGLNVGAANYLGSDDHSELPAEQQRAIAESIEILREKLGTNQEDQDETTLTTRDIPVGARIMVSHVGPRDDFDVVVRNNSEKGLQVQAPFPVESPADSSWILRYFDGVRVWGFTTPITAHNGTDLTLAHSDNVEMINFRRFARVPVERPASVCQFTFHLSPEPNDASPETNTSSPEMNTPLEFVHADVVEIGGPGVQIRTTLPLRVGERILLLLDFGKGGTLQAVGKIRRVIPSPMRTNRNGYGVELVGLSPSQAAELMHLTNSVAIRQRKEEQKEKESSSAAQNAGAVAAV